MILKLTRDFGVNLAGVEIILNMREKMDAMQRQIEEFISTLSEELAGRIQPAPPPERGSLIPVVRIPTVVPRESAPNGKESSGRVSPRK